ncbi:MAG: dUTP diphosphatase [Nanoarchaeota archaeon]|nr:dUTP diphosphatase [Nanoarchaeota archaeon]
MDIIDLKVVLEEGVETPAYGKEGDAGLDLRAKEDVEIPSGERRLIRTGIRMEIPHGYWGNIRDRSGLALKNGLHVFAGVVDSTYRGEVGVVLTNFGHDSYGVRRGDRIAQMVIQSYACAGVSVVAELSDTERGEGGFGSTGNH